MWKKMWMGEKQEKREEDLGRRERKGKRTSEVEKAGPGSST